MACGGDSSAPLCSDAQLDALETDCEQGGGELYAQGGSSLPACMDDGQIASGQCAISSGSCVVTCGLPDKHLLCGQDVSDVELHLLIAGIVVFVSQQAQEGTSVYDFLTGVIILMLVYGISFDDILEPLVAFDADQGLYTYETGRSAIGFRLFYAKDHDGHAAGDPIPHNVFDPRSYIRSVSVSIGGTLTDPRVEVDYDEGPLFSLVDGRVDFDGDDLGSLRASFKVHADLITFQLDSLSRWHFELPHLSTNLITSTEYDWELHQVSSRVTVPDLNDALKTGGFSVTWDGSWIDQTYKFVGVPFFQTRDLFSAAEFTILEDAEGNGVFEGPYQSTHNARFFAFGVERSGELYSSGLASTREQNWTELYCDEGRSSLWGTARHDLDLDGGVLTFADGSTYEYDLDNLPDKKKAKKTKKTVGTDFGVLGISPDLSRVSQHSISKMLAAATFPPQDAPTSFTLELGFAQLGRTAE